jgi:rubredoxin
VTDAETNVTPLTAVERLPPDWACPSCGADRDYFFP